MIIFRLKILNPVTFSSNEGVNFRKSLRMLRMKKSSEKSIQFLRELNQILNDLCEDFFILNILKDFLKPTP